MRYRLGTVQFGLSLGQAGKHSFQFDMGLAQGLVLHLQFDLVHLKFMLGIFRCTRRYRGRNLGQAVFGAGAECVSRERGFAHGFLRLQLVM